MFSKKLSCLFRKYSSTTTLLEAPPLGYGGSRVEVDVDPRLLLSNLTNLKGSTLAQTRIAHALLIKTHDLFSNVYAANNLITAYSDCSSVDSALKLFDETPKRNLVTWNLMISGCNKNSLFDYSWRLFRQIHNVGEDMDEFTYSSVLSACGALANAASGSQVYGLIWKNGFLSNDYVRAGMIDFFSKCGKVEDALRVLHDVDCDNVVCWNAVLSCAVKNKDHHVALEVFAQMCRYGSLTPTTFTFSSVLTACAALEELKLGKCIHGRVITSGVGSDVFVETAIIDLYAKCGAMVNAVKQFKVMPTRNVVSWTVIISGFVKKGDSATAFFILNGMRSIGEETSNFTFSIVLSACTNPNMLKEALQIHCLTFKAGLLDQVVKASLINTYSKVGAVDLSEKVFVENRDAKQVGMWSNMISAFVQSGVYEKAIILFQEMLETGFNPDMYIVSSILSMIDCLNLGRQVHAYTLKLGIMSEVPVGSSILTMYSKCGKLDDSLKAFEQLERKDNVSWTSMIVGFSENGLADKAIQLFQEMMGFEEFKPDDRILAAVLNSCSALRSLKLGREVHGYALQCGFSEQTTVGSALVNMYSKCGDLDSARAVFDRIVLKDQASRSFLISGLSHGGHVEEALRLFHDMLLSGVNVDAFTVSSILGALAVSSTSDIGAVLHAYTVKVGFEAEASVGSSLVMMYSKSGSIDECQKVFRQITVPDLVCWTTMIASYANNGKGLEVLQLFERMKISGTKPDAVTFAHVLSACSHAGLVDEGYLHLHSMIKDYGIEPDQKHYACMVDLLGRAGRLDEAKRFIDSIMHVKPTIIIWETLLAACKVHGYHELGKVAAETIMKLQPCDDGSFVAVSNIYAEAGEWDRVVKIREAMEKSGITRKEAGWSYCEA